MCGFGASVSSCLSSQLGPEDYREQAYNFMPEEVDTDVRSVERTQMPLCSIQLYKVVYKFLFCLQTKLSRLCEQDKVVKTQEDKLQQLYREKVGEKKAKKNRTLVITLSHKTLLKVLTKK